MSEIFIPLISDKNIKMYLNDDFDGFFVGIKKYSSNFNVLLDLEELKELINTVNKKIYVCLNRLYYNDEIEGLIDLVKELINLPISGICYTDNGLLNILKELNYKGDILWYSNHLGTNSNTIKFLSKRDVNYFLLSTEITKDEIIKIKNNCSKEKIGCMLYGYLNMATSSRKLLSNYFEYNNLNKDKDNYVIEDKVKKEKYFLVEKDNTDFFTYKVLNGIKFYPELLSSNIDFIYLDNYLIDEDKFKKILENFILLRKTPNNNYALDLEKAVNSNTDHDTYYGFLDKKTVFKVKDYE